MLPDAARHLVIAREILSGMRHDLARRRVRDHQRLLTSLRSSRFQRLIAAMADWVEGGPWLVRWERRARRQDAHSPNVYCTRELHRWRKRLIRKGYVKCVTVAPNRLLYSLTPRGVARKARLTYEFMKYSLDFYRDARRHLRQSLSVAVAERRDVLASIANYLADHGWRRGEPVVVPASLWFPKGEGLVAGKLAPNSTVKALRDRGLSFQTTQPDGAPALFIRVDGDGGPEYRAGFFNFGVITRYNRSVLYALAVNDLGQRIENLSLRGRLLAAERAD